MNEQKKIRFGSVCSGIEAASVAWEPLGWQAAWLSEIEPFPSAVLAHHYPDVPNLGDMTKLPERILSGEVEAPDLFCGGTPCQAFSVAGLRNSLDDARGNLSLTFCEIANAIDDIRLAGGNKPAIIFWENVPGVLSTKDNAFGCFLGALAGEDEPLQPAGGKWTDAGVVLGPQRAVAWRILDAQYFGVAQRRRRVFVVASARDGFDPAKVLFEFDGVRRDIAPIRETGQKVAPRTGSGFEGGICGSLTARFGGSAMGAPEVDAGLYIPVSQPVAVGTDRYNGSITGDVAATMGTPGSSINASGPTVMQPVAMRESGQGYWMRDDIAGTIDANMGMSGHANRPAVIKQLAMQVRRLTPVECERLQGFPDIKKTYTIEVCHEAEKPENAASAEQSSAALSHAQSKPAAVHVRINLERQEVHLPSPARSSLSASTAENPSMSRPLMQSEDIAHLVALMTPHLDRITGAGRAASQASTTGFSLRLSGSRSVRLSGQEIDALASDADRFTSTVSACLKSITSEVGQSSPSYERSLQTLCCCVVAAINSCIQGGTSTKSSYALSIETEIGYTAIPWRKKPASECPDGPRYKALGNSWAVPNVRWIGQRISDQINKKTS